MYSFVQSCAKRKDLIDARRMQCLMVDDGQDGIAFWNDHLIRLFADCGSLQEADRAFWKVVEPTVFTWNAIISAHAKLSEPRAALQLYARMQEIGVPPDVVTYISILKACGSIGDLAQGRIIHSKVTLNGLETDVNLGSTLISVYTKCACLEDGRHLFDMLSSKNVVTWGAMIAGYFQNSQGFFALKLFESMQEARVEPSVFTYSSTLKACGSVKAVCEGRLLHHEVMKRRYELDLVLGSTLISMYIDCGHLEEARRLFDGLSNPDIVSWDIIISGYVAHGQSLQALDIYGKMQASKVKPNLVLYLSLLQACGNIQRVDSGQSFHNEIVCKGLDAQLLIENTLIDMYAKSGFLAEAVKLFECLEQRDIASWGALIAGFVDNGFSSFALDILDKMTEQGIIPNRAIFLCSVKACSKGLDYAQGRLKHKQIASIGLDRESAIGNVLVDMYVQFSYLEEARRVFDCMLEVNELSWGLMLAGYANNSQVFEAFEMFDEMVEHGLKPNEVILLLLLSCCSKACAINHGRQSHMHVISHGLHMDVVLGSAIVDMYSKCGNLNDACKVFDGIPCKDVVLYGSMIDGFAQQGQSVLALQLFVEMVSRPIEPSKALFLSLLKASSSIEAITWGFLLHHYCCECSLDCDIEIGTSLLDLYAKCSYLEESLKVFGELEILGSVSYSAMISGCMDNGQDFAALELYAKMQEKGIRANVDLLLFILSACVTVGAIGRGRMIHGELVRMGADSNNMVRGRLCNMYANCGMIDEAYTVLEGETCQELASSLATKAGVQPKQDNYESGGSQIGTLMKGLEPVDSTLPSMLTICSNVGMLREACFHINAMSQAKGFRPNVQLYSCIVDLLGRTGHLEEAEFFAKTLPFLPDSIMWISLLTNSKTHTAVSCGRRFFGRVGKLSADFFAGCRPLKAAVKHDSESAIITMQCRDYRAIHKSFQIAFKEQNSRPVVNNEIEVVDHYKTTYHKDCLQGGLCSKVATKDQALEYQNVTNQRCPQYGMHETTSLVTTEGSRSNDVGYFKSLILSVNELVVKFCHKLSFYRL
ncbi:hypothetical protein L7F22_001735 [Adiantum nelumboides]|nr:hypothetical protein [Adiantum nelumboides]